MGKTAVLGDGRPVSADKVMRATSTPSWSSSLRMTAETVCFSVSCTGCIWSALALLPTYNNIEALKSGILFAMSPSAHQKHRAAAR